MRTIKGCGWMAGSPTTGQPHPCRFSAQKVGVTATKATTSDCKIVATMMVVALSPAQDNNHYGRDLAWLWLRHDGCDPFTPARHSGLSQGGCDHQKGCLSLDHRGHSLQGLCYAHKSRVSPWLVLVARQPQRLRLRGEADDHRTRSWESSRSRLTVACISTGLSNLETNLL